MSNQRKNLLLGAVIAVGLYFGGEWMYREYIDQPKKNRVANINKAQKDIKKAKQDLKAAEVLIEQMESRNSESLPGKIDVAQATYRSWLLEQARQAGLVSPSVEAGSVTSRAGQYQILSFSLRAKGTLEKVTRFLFDFYRTKVLHQIPSINLSPLGRSGDLDISISVQAISLPDAPAWEGPPAVDPGRLSSENWKDFRVIAERNIFGVGGRSDPADRTVLTAVTAVNGVPEVWFTGEEDKLFKFKPGDEIEFGRFQGKLAEVLPEDVILESSGERWLLSIGENFGQALPLPSNP